MGVNNEGALLKAVANQPVSVAIEAGGPDFRFYSKVAPIVFWLMQIYSIYLYFCNAMTGGLYREMWHGAGPRGGNCRVRQDSRWNQVLDSEELMGSGLGRERLR